ncbi:hypothetical protein CMV30_18505 [Nibricoccus aquaticus]|uniref:EF-hand domain-containing protein n=1 Tax=Nibricoccus aquaticus TaxID=2576891 RepID=A0A290QKA6_9BACT|nr:caspase family protein [Nibricoccus aquaticus]ATC65778.1 hypothetical protein CMV30_18505 [Nibricoccus aquaticus]
MSPRSFVSVILLIAFAGIIPTFGQDSKMVTVVDRNAPHPAVSNGHRENIVASFLSPDGSKLFTSDSKQLRVWDVASRRELSLLHVRTGGSSDWFATFVPEKKWLFTIGERGFTIINYETLAHVTGGSIYDAVDVVWDARHNRFLYVDNRGSVGEIVERDGTWTATLQGSLSYLNGYSAKPASLILLADGRLLIGLDKGHAIFDPVAWKEVSRVEGARRYFERGPAGTLFAVSAPDNKTKPATVEKLSETDISTLATLTLPSGSYVFSLRPDAFDAETNTLALTLGSSIALVDLETLKIREQIPVASLTPGNSSAYRIIHHPASKEWFLIAGQNVHLVDLQSKRHIATLGDNVFQPRLLASSPKGFEFVVSDRQENLKRVRFTSAGVQITDAKLSATALLYTAEGDLAFGNSASSEISFIEPARFPKPEYKLSTGKKLWSTPGHISASSDGSLIVVRAINSLAVISTLDGQVVFETEVPNQYIGNEKGTAAISPDNRVLVVYSPDGNILGFDLKTKKGLWTKAAPYGVRNGFFFLSAEVFACVARQAIEYRSTDTGDTMLEAPIYSHTLDRPLSCAISPDRKRLAIYDGAYVQVFDAELGEKLMEQYSFAQVTDLEFLGDSRYIVTAGEDNLLRIVDVDQRRELCSLALFAHSNDWVASAPDFRFDATDKAIDRMYVVSGATITPLESLFDKLYTPKLLAGLFTNAPVETPKVNFSELSPPPSVRLEFTEQARNLVVEDDLPPNTVDRDAIQVRATATASQAVLRELRLFQNGKLVATTAAQGTSQKHPFEVKLVPGENIFRAIAVNAQGTESRPAEVIVTYRPKTAGVVAGTAQPPTGLQLHLLIVGVNTYKNPKYNLNYAVADATAVKDKIEAQTKTIFTGVNVKFILNDQAQKSAITDAFKELTAKAGPRDVFVFYYAGHGVMTSDAKPEFYLVPHDVTQLYGADDALRQKGISSAELLELSKLMPAQKQLFILDACQSAGALTTIAMRGAAEEKAIAQLARSSGTHWLTASGSEQFATEFAQLGHGAFTYALLEGLAGRADTAGDGRITVNELKAFLESEVPEITQKHKGTPQFPSSYGFGQDFPITVIAK